MTLPSHGSNSKNEIFSIGIKQYFAKGYKLNKKKQMYFTDVKTNWLDY